MVLSFKWLFLNLFLILPRPKQLFLHQVRAVLSETLKPLERRPRLFQHPPKMLTVLLMTLAL